MIGSRNLRLSETREWNKRLPCWLAARDLGPDSMQEKSQQRLRIEMGAILKVCMHVRVQWLLNLSVNSKIIMSSGFIEIRMDPDGPKHKDPMDPDLQH